MIPDAPVIDSYEGRMQEVCERAEELETTTDRRLHEHAVAEAVAGPEAESDDILVADGGETPSADEPLHIGGHVQDRNESDGYDSPTMVVVGLDTKRADAYELGNGGPTVAEVNPEYPADDDVVEVVFPDRTDMDIDTKRYAYPRSRLELVAAVHDRDDQEDDTDGEWIEDDNGDRVPERSEPADFGGGESTGVQDL